MNLLAVAQRLQSALEGVRHVQIAVESRYFAWEGETSSMRRDLCVSVFVGTHHYMDKIMLADDQPTVDDLVEAFTAACHQARKHDCAQCGVTKHWPALEVLTAVITEAA